MSSTLALALALVPLAAPTPDWVTRGGESLRHPKAEFLTGFAVVDGGDKAVEAQAQAAGALATGISVRIRSEATDISSERDGAQRYYAAAINQTTSDVVVSGLQYATHTDGSKTWALAFVKRATVGAERRAERDRALEKLRAELAAGDALVKEKREPDAVERWLKARLFVTDAAEHAAVARSTTGNQPGDDAAYTAIFELSRSLEDRIKGALKRPAASLADAAATLALQLGQQGISTKARFTIDALTYGPTPFSSAFGREAAQALERALAARGADGKGLAKDVVIRGTYTESKDDVRLSVIARELGSGRAVASAETSLPKSAIPAELAVLPQNFKDALKQQKILGEGEDVPGNLKVELFTQKGSSAVVFGKGEEVQLSIRVNRPAYVRLIYLLANGLKVPLEQAYFIDSSKVNKLVEYPDKFEVAAPFGVEQLYATAFTEQPEPLPTKKVKVDGEEYDVIRDDLADVVVKTRGLKKKKPEAQTASATLTMTTTP
ncbi:DUF4384 domain-containing protein [Myxococcota bacterium]|nr:DUF4384 domain-containing protein [Myxococcota bacterium]